MYRLKSGRVFCNLGTDRLLRPRWGGGAGGGWGGTIFEKGYRQFWGISFENVQSVREVEILRHRIDIICCNC